MMVDEDELLKLEEASRPRRKGSRRGLTVRMLAAKTEWLEGLIVWHEDRVWWQTGGQTVHPEPADLAQTERTLNRVRRYPRSAALTFGDGEAWLERRFELLALAKSLSAIRCADLPTLIRKAKDREPTALEELTLLLRAEAYCTNGLPHSPAVALSEAGRSAAPLVEALVRSPRESDETRALAALVLGSLTGRGEGDLRFETERQRRAWQWGRAHGVSDHPALVARLLSAPEGRDLAYRCLVALQVEMEGFVDSARLRRWLATEVSPESVVGLAEALAQSSLLFERLANWRPLLPAGPQKRRRELAATFAETAAEIEPKVRDALLRVAEATLSPDSVTTAIELLKWLLPDTTPTVAWADEALIPIRAAGKLPREAAIGWLGFLHRRRTDLWPVLEGSRDDPREPRSSAHLQLQRPWCALGLPLFRFVERTNDVGLAEEALSLGVGRQVSFLDGATSEVYRLTLAIGREIAVRETPFLVRSIFQLVNGFRSAAEARRALWPLVQVLGALGETDRAQLFATLTEDLHGPVHRSRLSRAPSYVDLLLRHLPNSEKWVAADEFAGTLLRLDPIYREETYGVANELFAHFLARAEESPDLLQQSWKLSSAVDVACGLRDPDEHPPQSIIDAFFQHDLPTWKSGRDEGLKLLDCLPSLRGALRSAFAAQPHRCLGLIEKLGLTGKLAVEAREPLKALESEAPPMPCDGVWHEIVRLAPDLEASLRTYVRDLTLLNKPLDPPAGVVRTLGRPQKLAGELAYLTERVEREENPAFQARVLSLRSQLEKLEAFDGKVAAELRDHFSHIAGETALLAAEQQIDQCYARSLARLLGPLSANVKRDEDWLNAALLASNIEQNRLLLRRLLRAEAEGRNDWRETHPVNARFLKALSEGGVNAANWVSRRTRTAPCRGVVGTKVRIHLERRPLRILQMGNYFDTCLSADGCNAFSTVANACELNKRVIYATDGRGRVVARKLIGLNDQGDLIGYTTYTNVDTAEARTNLCRIIRAYVEDFAAGCGLTLADYGTVPRLFAQAWYDDGRVDWSDEEASPGKGQAHASRAAPMLARFSSRSRP